MMSRRRSAGFHPEGERKRREEREREREREAHIQRETGDLQLRQGNMHTHLRKSDLIASKERRERAPSRVDDSHLFLNNSPEFLCCVCPFRTSGLWVYGGLRYWVILLFVRAIPASASRRVWWVDFAWSGGVGCELCCYNCDSGGD
jgi:hypothetical protein